MISKNIATLRVIATLRGPHLQPEVHAVQVAIMDQAILISLFFSHSSHAVTALPSTFLWVILLLSLSTVLQAVKHVA